MSPGGRGVTCSESERIPLSHLCRGFTHKCFGLCSQRHHWFKLLSSHGEEATAMDGMEGGW